MKIALIHHQISSLMTTKAMIMQFWNLRRKSNLQMEMFPCNGTHLSSRGWKGKIPFVKILQLWITPHASLHCDFKVWFAFKFQEFYSITGTVLGWGKGKGGFSSGINSQSLEDTQVGYISQKYTLDNYTLKNTLWLQKAFSSKTTVAQKCKGTMEIHKYHFAKINLR